MINKRTLNIKIKLKKDYEGVSKGSVVNAVSSGFGCIITSGEHSGKTLNKSHYTILKILEN